MPATIYCKMTLYESYTAAKIGAYPGPKGLCEELVSKTKSKIGHICFNGSTDDRFFGFEKGILLFLIYIWATPNTISPSYELKTGIG